MFLFVGKGRYTKDKLIEQLKNMKVIDPEKVVAECEKRGSVRIGTYTIFAF